ncbi:hypothetical protein [Polaromonas sp. JS666]|uniref:hypothetical protein n=1 Tax=Polaromonas sp. (strain JS666 / ATCC BAA-500) TaxID=296591 RepID=UPI0000531E54|nr:hypothetical protein [Polaromonas sp. JS666]ABE46711.1 hypothetical protein Bpro_4834 [Polaromonas sp. JS666]UUZ71720.1 hypothetical protein LP415_23345 [Polaromonas sp. P1(28)-8]
MDPLGVLDAPIPPTSVALNLYERATRSLLRTVRLVVEDVGAFEKAVGIDLSALSSGAVSYFLDDSDVDWLNRTFDLGIQREDFYVAVESVDDNHNSPYEIHTRRELRLMLAGTKPLSVFSDVYPADPNPWVFPEDVFLPHVQSGRIIQREYTEIPEHPLPSPYRGVRVLIYALAAEVWRIDAYILMRSIASKSGWHEGFERLEGALLGYQEWQTDVHLQTHGRWWERVPQVRREG